MISPYTKKIVNFNILNNHHPDSNHKPSTLTQNFEKNIRPVKGYYNNQKRLIFDKHKSDSFLRDLNNELNILLNKDNIEALHYNFSIKLSTIINKFSIVVSCKNENRMTDPLYVNNATMLENPFGMLLKSA